MEVEKVRYKFYEQNRALDETNPSLAASTAELFESITELYEVGMRAKRRVSIEWLAIGFALGVLFGDLLW